MNIKCTHAVPLPKGKGPKYGSRIRIYVPGGRGEIFFEKVYARGQALNYLNRLSRPEMTELKKQLTLFQLKYGADPESTGYLEQLNKYLAMAQPKRPWVSYKKRVS